MADIRVKPTKRTPVWIWVLVLVLVVAAIAAYVLSRLDLDAAVLMLPL